MGTSGNQPLLKIFYLLELRLGPLRKYVMQRNVGYLLQISAKYPAYTGIDLRYYSTVQYVYSTVQCKRLYFSARYAETQA